MPADFSDEDRMALVNGQRLLRKVTSAQASDVESDMPVIASYLSGDKTAVRAFPSMAEVSRFLKAHEIGDQDVITLERRSQNVIYFI